MSTYSPIEVSQDQAGLHALQEQAAAINAQLAVMAAGRKELVTHLRSAAGGDAGRVAEVIAQQDAATAELRARLADLNARIVDVQTGTPQIIVPPPDMGRFPIDPDAITAVFLMFSIGIIIPLSIGLTRRLWRRPQPAVPATENMSAARLDRLEQAVDAIAIEIERVSESQRFVAKILTERPAAQARATANEAKDSASLNDGAPFLALGAGPIEPIRVAERQAVKHSITPH